MAVYVGENGELTMGNKTPVTILQEMLQKKGLVPQYELIYNGTGTLDPVFKYEVSAEGMSAIGDGKSKKQAKHDAAATFLKRMLREGPVVENGEAEVLDIVSPYDGSLQTNFVGRLEEVCVVNKIPFAYYTQVGEEGPPHARIFTFKCQISTISETATARTKKQAKHLVAQQMIGRIVEILGEDFLSHDHLVAQDSETEEYSIEEKNRKAIENGTYRHSLSTLVSDLGNVFHLRSDELPLPPMFLELTQKPEEFYKAMEAPKKFLTSLLDGLGGMCWVVETSPKKLQEDMLEIDKCLGTFLDCTDSDLENEEESTNQESEELSTGGIEYEYYEEGCFGETSTLLKEFKLTDSDEEDSPCQGETITPLKECKRTDSNEEDSPCQGETITPLKEFKRTDSNEEDSPCQGETITPLKEFKRTDSNEEDSPCQTFHSESEASQNKTITEETISNNLSCLNVDDVPETDRSELSKKEIVFLDVECPQGKWCFFGIGNTRDEAESLAAVKALLFLRALAFGPKKQTQCAEPN